MFELQLNVKNNKNCWGLLLLVRQNKTFEGVTLGSGKQFSHFEN